MQETNNQSTPPSVELLRHILGSIDMSDIEELKEVRMSDADYKARAGTLDILYKNIIRDVIKLFINKQLEFMATNTVDIQFVRGTINGLYLIDEFFQEQVKIASIPEEEKKEKTQEPIEPIGKLEV